MSETEYDSSSICSHQHVCVAGGQWALDGLSWQLCFELTAWLNLTPCWDLDSGLFSIVFLWDSRAEGTAFVGANHSMLYIHSFKKIFFNVYLSLRDGETQSMSRGGAEREGDTESKAGPASELSAQSLTRGSYLQTVRSRPAPKSNI